MFDNHFVLRVDGNLDVVTYTDLRMRGHRTTVGIRQRNLACARLLQSGQKLGILDTLFTNSLDFFGKVRGPRAVCTGFHGVALIEAMEIVVETFIRAFYELLKGVDRKIPVLVVDSLDTRTIDRKQLSAE